MNCVVPITGLYEVAIKVRDLSTAEAFYREVLGLQFGLRDQRRNWLFLRIGSSAGMVVLQEDRSEWPRQHFAFAVKDSELERAAALLKEKGISIEGPVFHDWMPGRSVYFADPDGHDLELFALTDHGGTRA
jgi:catechol 2,3-dioxygenase-like lactoylglutathione lyase family enzyme